MNTRFTVDQLEQMKTHELADLLANVVLLLRRMPNVECRQLTEQMPISTFPPEQVPAAPAKEASAFTPEELKARKLDDLKKLARELNIPFASKIKKDEIIGKLLAAQARGHSEQFAIQDI